MRKRSLLGAATAAACVIAVPTGGCALGESSDDSSAALSECNPQDLARFDVSWDSSVDPTALRTLLKGIAPGTKWADLSDDTRQTIAAHASAVTKYVGDRWGKDAFEARLQVLQQCPTPAMTAAFDKMVPLIHPSAGLPSTFTATTDVHSPDLLRALKTLHLVYYAGAREMTHYRDKNPDQDWDGAPFAAKNDGFRPHLPELSDALKARATEARDALLALSDASLTDQEKALKQAALYKARSYATGSFLSVNGWANGGDDDIMATTAPWMPAMICTAYGVEGRAPNTYSSPEMMLEAWNALWFARQTEWIDMGTAGPGLHHFSYNFFVDPSNTAHLGTDPTVADLVADYSLMRSWAGERMAAFPEAQNRCTIFTPAELDRIWDSFSADLQFNNDHSSDFAWAKSGVDDAKDRFAKLYRGYATEALNAVFPDGGLLADGARASVMSMIAQEPLVAQLPLKIPGYLDAMSGDTRASRAFVSAQRAAVGSFGGGYASGATVRPDEAAALQAMEDRLKTWIKSHYPAMGTMSQYVDMIPPLRFNTGSDTTSVANPGGAIVVALKNPMGAGTVYRTLMNWTMFSLYIQLPSFSGIAQRGSAMVSKDMEMAPFVREIATDPASAALVLLDQASAQATSSATDEAVIARYTRTGTSRNCADPSDPDTIQFVKNITASWGLDDASSSIVVEQAHVGTKYLLTSVTNTLYTDITKYLQAQVDPSGAHVIDPLLWYSCKVFNPQKDAATVAALKACLNL
jgi:hypothetical protein